MKTVAGAYHMPHRVLQNFGLEQKPFGSDISYVLFLLLLINCSTEMNLKGRGEYRKIMSLL